MLYDDYRKEKMNALKAKDSEKNKVITNILSAMTYAKKEKGDELDESECQAIIAKLLKQAQEAYDLAAKRPERRDEIKREMDILSSYLPQQLTAEEVKQHLYPLFNDAGIEQSPKSKGVLMKKAMAELKGKADGKVISGVVDSWIQGGN